jgi:hypothetical protein
VRYSTNRSRTEVVLRATGAPERPWRLAILAGHHGKAESAWVSCSPHNSRADSGLLIHKKEGRAFRYSPLMTEPEFVARQAAKTAGEMLERFGHVAISNFLDRVAADLDQLTALREFLEEQEKV